MNSSNYRLAGVMGWPIAHSRSPIIQNHWLDVHGLSGAYLPLAVAPTRLEAALSGLAALGFHGCNITIPHKVEAMRWVHDVDANARRVGAINTVVVQPDGSLKGYNHDGFGYIQSLLEAQPDWRADAGPVVVLGAGGASRAVVLALADRGAKEIRLLNRSPDKALALAHEFGAPVHALPWDQRHAALADAALLVNTTSQGMHGTEPLDLDLQQLPLRALVSDAIYVPLETPLLAAARQRGNPAVNGLGMLLHQARPAFQSWFGVMPEVSAELRALVEATL
ncbi:shikimate dehydrogenase [Rhodoferax sp.]|jgi:shikimate dehydrogenase|uniref:shikimate dehydrogenase n=1 Tax=Rhodoferax sp. TaxID=50421 RepID=UPI003784878E